MITTIASHSLEVKISSLGAELQSLKLSSGREYLWQGNPEFWKRRACVLFPFIGSLKNGKYLVGGVPYSMTSHGFARDMEFELLRSGDDFAEYSLSSNEKTESVYPFHFKLVISYKVEDNRLAVGFKAVNTGSGVLYYYLGSHPAFYCESEPGERFEDYVIEFEKPETIESPKTADEDAGYILRNGRTIPLSHALFDNGVFVRENPKSSFVVLRNTRTGHSVKLEFGDFSCLAVWSPAGKAPFVCLEPFSSLPSLSDPQEELSEKKHARSLRPGGEDNYFYQLTLN